ncbi:hypothetical protein DL765_009326 [Monosporascus sp. GIB2]|nr:hypothetical protein DL765_009326 [Monosporascus sp. GIB2]
MLLGDEAVEQGLDNAAKQRDGSAHFWKKANWTKEEKAKTLAPADEARHMVLENVHRVRESKLSPFASIKRFCETSKTLSVNEDDELDAATLQHQIKQEMDLAETQKNQWESKKGRGNKAILFLNDFVEFVREFSGIIEIMKGVDQGYGGAGYMALSFLLAVAVNTNRKDEMVAEAMQDLKNEYSRMVLISEIYPTPKMRSYITTTYKLGIEFVQDATIYYARPTWREPLYHSLAKINTDPNVGRILDSILRPPFLLGRKVKDVSDAMAQILKERDTLLNKRVHEIQAQVGQVQTEVGELSREVHQLKSEVAGLHTNHEKERLAILNSELSQYHIQSDKSVSDYSALLSSSFNQPPGLARFCFEMLTTHQQYRTWKNSWANCMLVLNGRTRADQTSCCWLSPASIELASALRQEASNSADGTRVAVAEFYAQKTDFMAGTVQQISAIVCLILQLLEADSTMLRDAEKFKALRARLTSVDSKSFSGFDQGFSLLVEIMEKFDVVYIIIDRVDRISGDFMRQFLKNVMLRCTGTKVRTFCVASRSQDMASKITSLSEDMDEKNFISLLINQD